MRFANIRFETCPVNSLLGKPDRLTDLRMSRIAVASVAVGTAAAAAVEIAVVAGLGAGRIAAVAAAGTARAGSFRCRRTDSESPGSEACLSVLAAFQSALVAYLSGSPVHPFD